MAREATRSGTSPRRKLGRGLGSLISTPVRVDVPAPVPPAQSPASAPAPVASPPAIAPGHAHPMKAGSPAETPAATIAASQSHVATADSSSAAATREGSADDSGVRLLPIASIHPNPNQPRQHFDEQALQALANSIASSGLMQPIVVRPANDGTGSYQIIAGERRWRAAQIAGLSRLPAVIREVDDQTAAEFALIENLQREDLNPIERAEAFQRLIDEFQLTHQEIAQRVGLDRSSVTNHLRLIELDDSIKSAIQLGQLSLGHAKALLGITNLEQRALLASQAVREGWSVREMERRVRQGAHRPVTLPASPKPPTAANAHMADLERRLAQHLGTKVHLHPGRTKGTGKLVIEFYSLDQFEGVLRQLGFENDS